MSSLAATGQRDTQRQRLYDAERDFDAGVSPAGKRLLYGGPKVPSTGNISIEAAQAYVDYVTTAAWFQSRWGYRAYTVKHKVHGAASHSWGDRIALPPWARTEWSILHEIAHGLTPDNVAWHGPEFAGIFLTLVRYQLGPEAAKSLRSAYRRHRVRSNFLSVPKPDGLVRKRESIRTATTRAKEQERRSKALARDAAARAAREAVSPLRRRQAEITLRALIKAGEFGPAGSASRRAALATAKGLEVR